MKGSSTKTKPTAVAYAVVSGSDEDKVDDAVGHVELPLAAVRVDSPTRAAVSSSPYFHTVSPAYQHITEARNLSWSDDYFEDNPNLASGEIVAVFDLDYDSMTDYYSKIGWTCYGATVCCFPGLFWLSLLACVPCHLRPNVSWNVRSLHVAVTTNGIQVLRERHPTCYGNACTEAGGKIQVIPFDQITDCQIIEAAGNTCVWIPNTLHHVTIDTASSIAGRRGEAGGHDLTLAGLKDPLAFCQLVWAMKRQQQQPSAPAAAVVESATPMERGGSNSLINNNDDDTNVASLLRDIRDELRQHNQRMMQEPNNRNGELPAPVVAALAATAPVENDDEETSGAPPSSRSIV